MNTRVRQVITALVLLILLSVPFSSVGAQGSRTAEIIFGPFNPDPVAITADTTFDLIISVANVSPGVGGAEIYLSYMPGGVEPSKTPGVGSAVGLPDFFGVSNVTLNEVLPAASCPGGTLPCLHLIVAGPPQETHFGAAVRFYFTGLAEGLSCFTILQAKLVDTDGYEVLPVTLPARQCVTVKYFATVKGKVLRQGTPANPNPGLGTLACSRVTANPGGYGPAYTITNGDFQLGGLPAATYTIRAEYPGYLPSEKPGVVLNSSVLPPLVDIGTVTLRGGDANGDNVINILDIGLIISKWGSAGVPVRSAAAFCTCPDEPSDINDDGLVNISDLAIAAGNWGKVGPTSWQ